MINPRALSCG